MFKKDRKEKYNLLLSSLITLMLFVSVFKNMVNIDLIYDNTEHILLIFNRFPQWVKTERLQVFRGLLKKSNGSIILNQIPDQGS